MAARSGWGPSRRGSRWDLPPTTRTTRTGSGSRRATGWFCAGAAVALSGCANAVIDEFETCALDLVPVASEGAPGDTIVLTGGPMSEVRDTRVEVGGVRAQVVEVTRDGCETCDGCRVDSGCAPCGLCAGIPLATEDRVACFGDPLASPAVPSSCDACLEAMAFVVPDLAAGFVAVLVINKNGQSDALPFRVLGVPDTASTGDTGAASTGDTSLTGDTSDTGA